MNDKKIFPRITAKEISSKTKIDKFSVAPGVHKQFFSRYGNHDRFGTVCLLLLMFCIFNANLMYNGMNLLKVADGKKTNYEIFKEVYTDPAGIFLMASFVLLGCVVIGVKRVKHNAIDIMLAVKELGADYNLDTRKVKRAVTIAPVVISNMAAADREFFDKLMNGDIEIKDDDTMRDMAISIIEGHLQTHPLDAGRVLAAFKEETIPGDLLVHLKKAAKTKQR